VTVGTRLDVRIVRPHRVGCRGEQNVREGRWTTAWWLTGKIEGLSEVGDRRGTWVRWLVAECNASNISGCRARALVREEWLAEQIDLMGGLA
jgi:hypothetical protein